MAMRYQPQGTWRLGAAYRGLVAGGWLAQASGYASLGPASLIPTTRFTQLQTTAVTPFGLALSANAASDAAGSNSIFSSLTINSSPARRNFTFAGVFRVRAIDGAGVGARSSTNDILFRRETNGAFGVRVNGVSSAGGSLALDTPLHYVLTSNADGIFVSVNGVEVIAAARSASTTTTGAPVEVFEDTLRGGAMDLDSGMCVLLNAGIGREAARALSNNLWQMFAEPDDEDDFVSAANNRALQVGRASLVLAGGMVGMRVSRRLRSDRVALAVSAGAVAMRAARRIRVQPSAYNAFAGSVRLQVSRRFGVQPAGMSLAGQGVALRAGRRLAVAPVAMALAGRTVGMQYSPTKPPGSYTLPVSAAAMQLGAGGVSMRVSRRLAVASAQLQVAAGAVRALVGRRLLVDGARLVAQGRSVTLRYSAAAPPFDITKIHPSRVVIFEGSGSRVTPFEGSGSRVTPFDGSGSRVTPFEGSGSRVTRFE